MTREELIERLLALPGEIAQQEARIYEVEMEFTARADDLREAEDRFLLEGRIDGKNEAVRAAQMRDLTAAPRENLKTTERRVSACRITLRQRQNEFAALRAVARLLAAGAD